MPGGLTLLASANADIPTPPAGKVTIYFSTNISAPAYKDSTGTVTALQGAAGATGAQGPIGPSVIHEDIIYPDDLIAAPQLSSSSGSSGAPWSVIATSTPTGVALVDFTGLLGYTDIRVILSNVAITSSGKVQLRVSVDNGGTFLSSAGDYQGIQGNGQITSPTELSFYDTNATAGRYGEILLQGINITGAPKSARSTFFNTDAIGLSLIPNTNDIDAIRVFAGSNFVSGTIYVLGRR